ncbi:MAG TPA: YciI-like protein, partial [Steroidobacteraceae bacterium]|nr:YciI-like protein [Steroidobacteraceae bacterium]
KFEEHIFMHYLLIYEVAPDYLARRAQYRDVHLALAWQAAERGELLLGGAVGDPIEGSILLFSADSAAIPEAFARADPYVVKGLVTRWRVAPWRTVAGHQASNPIRAG